MTGRGQRDERASSWFLRVLAAACQAHELDAAAVLASAGLPPELLASRDGRVSLERARASWDEAARLSRDADFGLHAAERMPAGSLDVLEYVGRSVATLGEMLGRVAQLGSTLTEDGELSLTERPKRIVLRHRARRPLRHVSELLMGAIVVRGRQFTGVDFAPSAVSFIHAAPSDTREHQRLFRCKLAFGQPADELHLASDLLKLPLSTFEPALASILDDYVRLMAGRTLAAPGMLADVNQAIGSALPSGEPRLEDVARSLCVTPRTLQRRLKAAGTSFQTLLDGLRYELAVQYLDEGELGTTKLALLLGFSEPSAFYRAYKRWTGKSLSRESR